MMSEFAAVVVAEKLTLASRPFVDVVKQMEALASSLIDMQLNYSLVN